MTKAPTAAWLGLVPKQHSSHGKRTFGADDQGWPSRYLTPSDHWRNVAAVLAWTAHNYGRQLAVTMFACKPKMLVAIALASKMARQIWAMLTKNEDYKPIFDS